RVVRRDGKRAEADRQRLTEGDHPANDGQPENATTGHRRGDRLADLGDFAVGFADGHCPARRAAHHHALQDGLPAYRLHGLALVGARALEAALEALDATTGVDELLLARVEGVARRANLDVELRLRRARDELVSAGAANGREDVLRMNVRLHRAGPG